MIVGINQQAMTVVLQLRNLEAVNVPLRIQMTWNAPGTELATQHTSDFEI